MEETIYHEKTGKSFEIYLSKDIKKKCNFYCSISKYSKYYIFDEDDTFSDGRHDYMYRFSYNIETSRWKLEHQIIGEFKRSVAFDKDYFEIVEAYLEDYPKGIEKTFEMYQNHCNYKDELDY